MQMRKYMRGVTLLELMIVVVLISIMAAVAYPNYRQYAARAKRTEAKAMLLEIAAAQERYYLQNSTYGTLAELGYDDPYVSDTGTYEVTVAGPDASNYTARATYQKADDELGKCGWFEIDGRGDKTSDPYTDCWTRSR
jgi:type IV pilus assembly protein PilE